MKNLSIRRLRSFLTVAEMGSVTTAAKFLNQTQGAVSQQLSKLDEEFSANLFERKADGLKLSQAGEEIYRSAKDLVQNHDRLVASSERSELKGSLSIGFPLDLSGKELVARVMRSFIESHPGVSVKIRYGSSTTLRENVKGGALDLALIEEHPDISNGLVLYRERLIWIGAQNGKSYTDKVLPVSLVSESCVYRPYVLAGLEQVERPWKCVFDSDSYESTIAMIRMDLAVGVVLSSALPGGCAKLDSATGLPRLPEFNISLIFSDNVSPPVKRLEKILCSTFIGAHVRERAVMD